MGKIKLDNKTIKELWGIQEREEKEEIDLCNEKLDILYNAGYDSLPVLNDYDGFSEPQYPYSIYLYPDELVIIKDGETFVYKLI